MKSFFTSLFILFFFFSLKAQQPGHYSLYMFNRMHWNPAYAGLDHSLSFTGIFRKQWVDLNGSPTTQNINVHMPLYMVSGGIGLNLENDALGAERMTSAVLAYNYQAYLGSGILSFGIGGGIVQRVLDGSLLRTPDGIYTPDVPDIDHQDDILPLASETAMTTTFQAGIYYQSEKIEGGISVKNLAESTAALSNLNLSLVRNYFFTFSGHFDIGRSLSFHPSLFVRSDLIQTQTDISAIFRYNDNIFAGGSFRGYDSNSIDAVSIIVGFKLSEKITVAYAYDLTLSDIGAVSNGSHEVMVNYNLNKRIGAGRPPRIIYNPRSL